MAAHPGKEIVQVPNLSSVVSRPNRTLETLAPHREDLAFVKRPYSASRESSASRRPGRTSIGGSVELALVAVSKCEKVDQRCGGVSLQCLRGLDDRSSQR